MAALLKPQAAYDLVKGIKETCGKDTLVHLHCHSTTGVTLVSYMKAIEAGVDIVDTAISSLSLGPGHNPTESLVEMLEGTGVETRLDMERLLKVRNYFKTIRPRYKEFLSDITGVETEIFQSQIPGGMISNMESQLKQQGAGDKLEEVLLEVPRVRKAAGYPPLVTPSSQIVGTQAVFNVLMGPYKVLTGEFADLMLGYYGETIGPKDPEVLEKARVHAKKEPITCRPADLLKPEWEALRADALALKGCNGTDEDVLTFAMFPQVAPKFFGTRDQGAEKPGQRSVEGGSGSGGGCAKSWGSGGTAQRSGQVRGHHQWTDAQRHRRRGAVERRGSVEYGNDYSQHSRRRRRWKSASRLCAKSARRWQEGGGEKRIEKQHEQGKLTARERVEKLVDPSIVPGDWRVCAASRNPVRHGGERASGRRCCDRMRPR